MSPVRLADQRATAHGTPYNALELPASTKVPLERANPLLSCAVSKWLKAHGKTAKPKLTEEQRANLRMCFKMMDADGSGAIDAEELGAAFKLLGLSVSRREVEAMLAEVDRDGSGEVEYAEFLEIMTLQLTRLAEQKEEQEEAAAAASRAAAPAAAQACNSLADAGNACGETIRGGFSGTANTALLPFDIVATAYRRKKLMGALEADDRDFILSVAEAEEDERLPAEEAEQAAARRSRRPSAVSKPGSRRGSAIAAGMQTLQPAGSELLPGATLADDSSAAKRPPPPITHASFLDSLSKEERRVIDALSRKFRDDAEESAGNQQGLQRQRWQQGQRQQQQKQISPSAQLAGTARTGASGALAEAGGDHLAALQAVSQAATMPAGQPQQGATGAAGSAAGGMARSRSLPRPAGAVLTEQQEFRVQYRLTKSAAAGALGTAAQGAMSPTEGLLLPAPQFSMRRLGS